MKQRNNERLSDKAFTRLIATSILGILLCMIFLCGTTYAWFSDAAYSNTNEIKTAECLLTVTVYKDGAEEAIVDTQNAVTLNCEGEYTVTLTLPKNSASGYLVLSAGNKNYYTDYLLRNDEADQTLTFTLNVETATSVTFTARWGIYSGASDVINNGLLSI